MVPEIKRALVDALLSGKYKQTQRVLRNRTEFCFSGVLCDLHSQYTGTKWQGYTYLNMDAALPAAVSRWAGLPDNPKFVVYSVYLGERVAVSPQSLNDNGWTFASLAKLVEAQW